ncbi:MAG: SdrD B-like domain-containing protein [Pseudomonadales bacterium]
MRNLLFTLVIALLGAGFSSEALAYSISGYIYCDTDGQGGFDPGDTPLAGVTIVLEDANGTTLTTTTGEDGRYLFEDHLGQGSWTVSIDPASLNAGASVALPAVGAHSVELSPANAFVNDLDFLVDDPACRAQEVGACWMTAGGVKFEPIINGHLAEKGPKDTFGGNVFPSCSPEPGDGGQWNHVAHSLKVHFMGTTIDQVVCGNVEGIEPGSESPVTPFNFIEFSGSGWIQGIKGNKLARQAVTFNARVEDRNEPGNEGAAAGENVDRYYLNVHDFFTVEALDEFGNPTGEPITITGGNLQLHASSYD